MKPPLEKFRTLLGLFPLGKPSDKRSMGRFQDFAEVLASQIRQEIEASLEAKSTFQNPRSPLFPSENELFPSAMAWLMGQIEKHEEDPVLNLRSGHRAYGVRPKPRRPHRLDARQTEAYVFLKTHATELPPGFTLRELKSAYRQAALRLHPDQGGDAALFRELHAAVTCLQAVLSVKTTI